MSDLELDKLIELSTRRLQYLREQAAILGQSTPPEIRIEIEDIEAEIVSLQAQLSGSPLLEVTSNLPRLPFFFGREDELDRIAEALAPENRGWGILIDGPGGIGKTALAIKAAEVASTDQFSRKIFLSAKIRELRVEGEVALTDFSLSSFADLLTELGRELGDDSLGKAVLEERPKLIRTLLSQQRVLLVLDNLETLPESERTRLYQFLDHLPLVCKAIVTSRRRQDINARTIRLDRISQDAGLALLDELGHNNPRLARTSLEEREELYEVTHGNPLLIRWLAGQLGRSGSQCHTVADACRFIEQTPPHNDPLEYAFGDLLDTFTEAESLVLAALSHFSQPAKVDWLVEMANLPLHRAQSALEDLSDRALLQASAEFDYFFLPPLTATFLRRKRPQVINLTGKRLMDAVYPLVLVNGYDEYKLFPIVEEVWPMIQAALPLFIAGDNAQLQRVCDALVDFLNFSGRWDDALKLNTQAEQRARIAADFDNIGWRAYQAGCVYYLRGQAEAVLQAAKRATIPWQKAQAGTHEQTAILELMGKGYRLQENYPDARDAFQKALALQRQHNLDNRNIAVLLNDLGGIERLMSNYDAAEAYYQEARQIDKKVGNQEGLAVRIGNLAQLAVDREDWKAAEELAREALSLSEAAGRQDLIGGNCHCIAEALARQRHYVEGLPYARRAVKIFNRLRSPYLKSAQETLRKCEGGVGVQSGTG